MAADQRRSRSGEDRISGLPDELLHDILVRLRCVRAAARTSVLSRRWRHVWAHLPELRLDQWRQARPGSFLDTVAGALGGYSAPTLERLSISLSSNSDAIFGFGASRIAPWLHFAAKRVMSELSLDVPQPPQFLLPHVVEDETVLELPACQGAKRIELSLTRAWKVRLRPQAASGLFTALTSMTITRCRMEGSELTSLVCRQCPCLRDLYLFVELIAVSDVSMHSNSLRSLVLNVRYTRRLEVMAPTLEELTVYDQLVEAYISASKLVMLAWHGPYDPHLHRFAGVGRSLRLLETSQRSALPFLTQQFDEVDEFKLSINIPQGVTGYERFLNETNKLPKPKSYEIYLAQRNHALVPSILQLLRNCISTKKLLVLLHCPWIQASRHSCPPSCPCCLEENHNIDGIALSSLEEVEIRHFTYSLENMELLEFLSFNAAVLKRLVINYTMILAPPLTMEVCKKVRSICHANVEVKFNVFRHGRLVPFD